MNRFDVTNLENSLDNLGQTIFQNRMMQDQKAERGQARQDRLGEQAKVDDYRQQMLKEQMARTSLAAQGREDVGKTRASDEHRKWLETLGKLNASGNMDDDTRQQVNQELSDDPDFAAGGVHFQFKEPTKKNEKIGSSAVAEALQQAEQWRQKAAAAETPEDKARYLKYADTLEKSTPSELRNTPQVKLAPPDRTSITTGDVSRTNTTTYAKPPFGQIAPPKPVPGTNDPLNLFGQ